MTSSFTVHDAAGYEQLMGRWSQKLAPLFIDFTGLSDGEEILDVGCGTGALTAAICARAEPASVLGCDPSEPFIEYARERESDPRARFVVAQAPGLPASRAITPSRTSEKMNSVMAMKSFRS